MMPDAGNLCPLDETPRRHAYCLKCGGKCVQGNMQLFLALMGDTRPVVKDNWSVTQVTSPLQITVLKNIVDYYPRPKARASMVLGTAWHMYLESMKSKLQQLRIADDYVMEKRFVREIELPSGTVTFGGTPDLYIKSQKTLWDHKLTKAYSAGKAFDSNGEWFWQTNIYKYFAFPEAEKILIDGFVKDFGWETNARDGIEEVEIKDVPMYSQGEIYGYLFGRLSILKACQDLGVPPPECTDEERWLGWDRKRTENVYKRCERYCAVSDVCPQWQGELNESID